MTRVSLVELLCCVLVVSVFIRFPATVFSILLLVNFVCVQIWLLSQIQGGRLGRRIVSWTIFFNVVILAVGFFTYASGFMLYFRHGNNRFKFGHGGIGSDLTSIVWSDPPHWVINRHFSGAAPIDSLRIETNLFGNKERLIDTYFYGLEVEIPYSFGLFWVVSQILTVLVCLWVSKKHSRKSHQQKPVLLNKNGQPSRQGPE